MGKFHHITNTEQLLRTKIDLNDLINNLSFSDEETSEAARLQPELFISAAIYRVTKQRKKQAFEAKLKLLRSEKAKKYRTELRELGQRVTDKEIEEKLLRNSSIRDLNKELDAAEQEEEFSKLLLEAMRMRSSSIKVVSELIGAEVYVSRRMTGEDTHLDDIRKKLKERYPGRVAKEERRERK